MDSTTNYLAQAKDAKDGAKPVVEAADEEIVVFANGNNNGLKSGKAAGADPKLGADASEAVTGAGEGAHPDNNASAQKGPADSEGLVDAFKSLSVNTKADKFDYGNHINDYRTAPKYPTINVSPHGDGQGSAGGDWQQQQSKGRKNGDEPTYGGAPAYGTRPLNASASDFQHRGAPAPAAYPGYGAPGAAYGQYQPGAPPMHGSYVTHGYDVFGHSPTLTEAPVNGGGVPGGPNAAGPNGNNASGNRYAPPPNRNTNANDPSGMGLNLNGLGGGAAGPAPYSPIPMSPSPLSLNPYAVHHQMQMNAHLNGHAMGASNGQQNGGAPANANGAPPAANGNARGYAPPSQPFNGGIPYGVPNQQQYYDESAMYAAGYGAPHLQHGMHPQYQMNPQLGPPGHPGTPQLSPYGAYMPGPMLPGVGAPGMLPVPGGAPSGPNNGGAGHANGGQAGHQQQGANASNAPAGVTSVVNGLTLVNGVPQPNADGTGPSANNRKLGLYKTELCRSWEEKGSCRYGPKCQFAHGEEEIRKVARHPKYKTEICRTFWLSGSCPYGKRCCFIHTDAPTAASGGEPGKGAAGTGPSTAAAGAPSVNGPSTANPPADGAVTPTHTRTASAASEAANDQPPSSLLARISANKARDSEKDTSPQGPARVAPRPDFAHSRHLSSVSDGRNNEAENAPSFSSLARPGHSHSASAHTLMTPTFSTPNNGANGFPSGSTPVDGGSLAPGTYWGEGQHHKRSVSGGSAYRYNGTDSPSTAQPEQQQQLRSIYSSLTPTA